MAFDLVQWDSARAGPANLAVTGEMDGQVHRHPAHICAAKAEKLDDQVIDKQLDSALHREVGDDLSWGVGSRRSMSAKSSTTCARAPPCTCICGVRVAASGMPLRGAGLRSVQPKKSSSAKR